MKSNISNISLFQELWMDGTSPSEVFCVTFFVPLSFVLVQMAAYFLNLSSRLKDFLQICIVNGILLLALTVFSKHLVQLFSLIGVSTLAIYVLSFHKSRGETQLLSFLRNSFLQTDLHKEFTQHFISSYRGHLLLATSICILAVDFNFFPSKFAKTETYGWSVMDAGVGSFVLVHGLCSSYARKPQNGNSFKKCLMSSLPLLLLGFLRLLFTTALNYHKVVSEYGVHWNFFFTLAFTKMLCYFLMILFPLKPGILSLIIIILHQWLLIKGELTSLILSDDRRNLFEENKEGICSLLGFMSLYFYGIELGSLLWKTRHKTREYLHLLLLLCGIGLCGWILMYVFHVNVQPISRRMANLSYCVWVVSLTTLQIVVHFLEDMFLLICSKCLKHKFDDCLLWKAINFNALFYFLLANVITGVVNLSIDTSEASSLVSFIVLVLYLTILTLSTIIFYKHSIHFKFW